jgi:hypothetical protein
MDSDKIQELLSKLDGSGSDSEWAAAKELQVLGEELPRYLLDKFRNSRQWKHRCSCVYHAVRYARSNEDAVLVGREAIRDKSKMVRYRGCMLLAYAQREDTLPELKEVLKGLGSGAGSDDVRAAIDAIEHKNHNYFVDRKHSGKITLAIHPPRSGGADGRS